MSVSSFLKFTYNAASEKFWGAMENLLSEGTEEKSIVLPQAYALAGCLALM